jgi:hypothetical protein
MRVTLPSRLVTFHGSDAFFLRNVPALRPISHLAEVQRPEHLADVLACLLDVLFACGRKKRME